MRGSKRKPPPWRGLLDRPARERARDFDDVLLRIAAIDAKRVQLHQLAPVVLVEPALLPLRPRSGSAASSGIGRRPRPRRRAPGDMPRSSRSRLVVRVGIRALPVVEIEEHRRALRGRAEQIAELAEHVRPDRVALVLREVDARVAPCSAKTLKWLNQKSVITSSSWRSLYAARRIFCCATAPSALRATFCCACICSRERGLRPAPGASSMDGLGFSAPAARAAALPSPGRSSPRPAHACSCSGSRILPGARPSRCRRCARD